MEEEGNSIACAELLRLKENFSGNTLS